MCLKNLFWETHQRYIWLVISITIISLVSFKHKLYSDRKVSRLVCWFMSFSSWSLVAGLCRRWELTAINLRPHSSTDEIYATFSLESVHLATTLPCNNKSNFCATYPKRTPLRYSLDTQADRVGHSPLHLSHLSSNCTSLILWHCDFDLLPNITFDEHHHQPTLVLFFFSQTQQCRPSLPSSHFTESFCFLRKEMLRECNQDVN